MIKIFKYFKKSYGLIFLVVILLFAQANCELALPDQMAKIVNIGIQQSGISSPVPDTISKSLFDKVLIISGENADLIKTSYSLISKTEENIAKYPLLSSEDVYTLSEVSEETFSELELAFSKALSMIGFFESAKNADDAAAENETFSEFKETLNEIIAPLIASLPPGSITEKTTLIDILGFLPEQQRNEIVKSIDSDMLEGLPPEILSQMAIQAVKAEYQHIGIDTNKVQSRSILFYGLHMLLLTLGSVLSAILVTFISSRIAAGLGRNLRFQIFKKVLSFGNSELDNFSTASLITRSTNDIQQIQLVMVMMLRIVFYAPIMGVGGVLRIMRTDNTMTWIIALAVLIIMVVIVILFTFVMPKFKKLQKLIDRINLVAREILTGLPVIRAYNNEKYEEARFDKANRDLTNVNLFVNRAMSLMMPIMMFVMSGVSILIVWVGSHSVDAGTMQVGNMISFIQYSMQIIMSFLFLSMLSIMLPRATVSANRISEVLETPSSVNDPQNPKDFSRGIKGLVEFKDVSFRYPRAGEDVLTDINFTAKPGQTTAIIGSTGSGKSTLINLIPRFFDVTAGEILIDGIDIRDVTQSALREKIGYVPQRGVLFSGTIASNIGYGGTTDESALQAAAQVAQAADFIAAKENGLESEVSQGGTNVSGGQRQRLSIARAVAKNPEIYIFDDSFSALDFKTDKALRAALKESTGDSTVIIVAQRISTIISADQIVVMDEGRIVGIGTHKELLSSCEEYYQIASSQLSEEELSK